MKKTIVSLVLVVSMLFSALTSAMATNQEEFISEVSLVYEDSVEEAREAIKGTDWKLFEKDLNPKADYMIDDGVYLIYKTTTNVDEAITDLRVMDMYGGFNVTDYEKQLENSRAQYLEIVKRIRVAAEEFKVKFNEGDEMAKIAYRQLNYYKDVKTANGNETDMLMGDLFLSLPSDSQLVQIMMEGNSFIVGNLVALLAIGISGDEEETLAQKIEEQYKVKSSLTHEVYYDNALTISKALEEIRDKILRYDTLKDKYKDDLDSEDMTEEEYVFVTQYATVALLLEGIKLGEDNLSNIIRKGEWEVQDLYPIAAALSKGQIALVELGQLELVLKYNSPSKSIKDLNDVLDEAEKDLKDENGTFVPFDVYLGVDRSIFTGAFAMTTAAERQQALAGETWSLEKALGENEGLLIAASVLGTLEVALLGSALTIVVTEKVLWSIMWAIGGKIFKAKAAGVAVANGANWAAPLWKTVTVKWLPAIKPLLFAAAGVALVTVGVIGIGAWYNYYNPNYTVIPNVMIDVRETDLGDRYIKYNAAKVFGEDDMNADFNAFEGKEWIALYYTKDASAGNCLTPNFVYRENNNTVSRRHQGISMFGETTAFNLNSHVYNDEAPGIYVTVRYSMTKKSTENLPSVVGSILVQGAFYLLTATAGACIGVGATLFVQKSRKKKEKVDAQSNSEGI